MVDEPHYFDDNHQVPLWVGFRYNDFRLSGGFTEILISAPAQINNTVTGRSPLIYFMIAFSLIYRQFKVPEHFYYTIESN